MCNKEPKTPDPYAVADAQGKANTEAAFTTTTLNRPDQITPWGNQTWSNDPSNPEKWTSTISLSPAQQALSNTQDQVALGLGDTQIAALERVQDTFGQPIDEGGLVARSQLPGIPTELGADRARMTQYSDAPDYMRPGGGPPIADVDYRTQIQDALYNQQKSRLDPRFSQQRGDLEARLASQGITQGSEAYNREFDNFGRAENDAYSQAMQTSITGGEAATAGQFGRDMGSRQQLVGESDLDYRNRMATHQQNTNQQTQQFQNEFAQRGQAAGEAVAKYAAEMQGASMNRADRASSIEEALTKRNLPLNELNALRTGAQVVTPQFSSGQSGATVGPAPVADSIWNSYNGQVANNAALTGGVSQLGGSLLTAAGAAGGFAPLMAGL